MSALKTLSLAGAAAALFLLASPGVAGASGPSAWSPQAPRLEVSLDLSAPAGPGVDLDLKQNAADAPTIDEFKSTLNQLRVRREMLTAHQVLAWTAIGNIIGAQVVGLVNRASLNRGTPKRATLEPTLGAHRLLAGIAVTTYWSAGVLAWAAPGPAGTRKSWDKGFSKGYTNTRDIHIALSIGHNIAMALTIITGALQANAVASKNWEPLVVVHTVSAFATVGFMIPAALVISRF